MSFLRQLVLTVLVVAVAGFLWLGFVPGARDWLEPHLERAGLGEAIALVDRVLPRAEEGGDARAPSGPPRGFGGPTLVAVAEVGERVLVDRVSSIGDGAALRSVAIQPEVSGRVAEVPVSAGQRVEVGQVLLRLEAAAEDIALDRARLGRDDAAENYARVEQLARRGAATELQLRTAQLALRQSELALRQAEFDLERRSIVAPITGWIGLIDVSPGDQVVPASVLMRVDDRSAIEVEFRLPERLVGRVLPGALVSASPLAAPETSLEGRIVALDNRVERDSRTLRARASLPNPDDRLRAGMAFLISMSFEGDSYPSVPPLAIQWTSTGAHVWLKREGRAQRVPVRLVQRGADAVLVSGELRPGDTVIVEGVQSLRPGAEVREAGEGGRDGQPAPRAEASAIRGG